MLLTLMMNLGMFGPTPPTPSNEGVPMVIQNKDEGGRYHKSKEEEMRIKNNEMAAIIVSTFLINNN